jgi:polar amino acid transport system substrate-binding protein
MSKGIAAVLTAFCVSIAVVPAHAQVLDKIKKDGVIKVCAPEVVPDLYKDVRSGKWHGVMADMLTELAEWTKTKIEYVEVGSFDAAILTLKQGNCDLVGSSMIYSAPRAMEVNFIRPFGAKGVNAVIPKANPKKFKNPADLNSPNVTIVARLGSREQETAKRQFPKAKLLAVKVPSAIQVVEQVKRGDADAALLPAITIKWWLDVAENASWGMMAFPGQDFGNAPNGWAIRYGDPAWKDFLDNYSGYIAANDISNKLYEQYLSQANPYKQDRKDEKK